VDDKTARLLPIVPQYDSACRAGRVFSWEMALFVCGEMLSATLGGAAFDLGLGTRGVAAGLTIVATALSVRFDSSADQQPARAGDPAACSVLHRKHWTLLEIGACWLPPSSTCIFFESERAQPPLRRTLTW